MTLENINIKELPENEQKALANIIDFALEHDITPEKARLALLARHFTREGFAAFFELLHGTPLHKEGVKWVNAVFDAIEKGRRKALIEAFRGSGKTVELSKHFVAFYIAHHPHTTNGIIRVNGQKANETVNDIKEMVDNDPMWNIIFPHVRPDKARGWGEKVGYFFKRTDVTPSEWKDIQRKTNRPTGPSLIGYGYDSGSIQGFRTNGVLLVDDIHDKENTRSDRQMHDVKEFVKFQLKPIPVPNEGIELWCFTPWRTNDAYADRKATKLYAHCKSPVMYRAEDGEGILWPEEFGDEILDEHAFPFKNQYWHLNWPERWDLEAIAEKYIDIGHMAFAREYLLDLEATKGQDLKKDWLHYFDASDIKPSWPVYMGVDYASVRDKLKHKDRDYCAISILRAIPHGGLVLIDGYRGHLTKGEAIDAVIARAALYPTLRGIGVESIGKGEEFYNDLFLINDETGKPLPLREIKHGRRSKGERFEEWLGPRFQMARIWVSDASTPFLFEFENEWLSYPAGEHDDCLDAVYMGAFAGEVAMPSRVERTGKKDKRRNTDLAKSIGRHL